jgi:hypothetical protein
MRAITIFRPMPILIFLLALLLSACNMRTAIPDSLPTAVLREPIETLADPTPVALPTQTPPVAAVQSGVSVTLSAGSLSQDVILELIAAAPPGPDAPWWEAMPQHTVLTLLNYPITDHWLKPQVFVYPVEGLGVNDVAAQAAQRLQTLLEDPQLLDQQGSQNMPYLPLYNEVQVLHIQTKFLDFQNGKGVRFLTEYSQAALPVNNHRLFYTYQGLSGDNQYYVSAVLPVNLPELPANENITDNLPPEFIEDFSKYLADTVSMLEKQPASAYTPDLSLLDALVQSIEIK